MFVMRGEEWKQEEQRILEKYGGLLNGGKKGLLPCEINDTPQSIQDKRGNIDILSRLSLPRNKMARFIVLEVMALLTILFIFVSLYIIFLYILFPERQYPHLIGEDIFSREFLITGVATVAKRFSLVCSIPLGILVHVYVFKNFFIRREKKDGLELKEKINILLMRLLPRNKIVRFIVLEVITLLISLFLFVSLCLVFLFIWIPERLDILGESNLARAFVLVGAMIIGIRSSLVCSIPLSVLLHVYVFKKFFIRREEKNG
jgi:hypothetical protein